MFFSANSVMEWYVTNPLPVYSPVTYPKIQSILNCINSPSGDIRLAYLKTLVFTGIPEEFKGLRALVWKVLLGYLPSSLPQWERRLKDQRDNYDLFKKEFLTALSNRTELLVLTDEGIASLSVPLTPDEQAWFDIEKDIKRTRSVMNFFYLPTDSAITVDDVIEGRKPNKPFVRPFSSVYSEYYSEITDENDYTRLVLRNESIEKHSDVMARILFLYAKLNPGIKYVQGMNEILAPIYYCFAQDPNPDFRSSSEADSFYCFTLLMAELRDTFVKNLDSSEIGLHGKMETVRRLIKRHLPSVATHLDELRIVPHFYAMKWVMLLFTQDFELPEVLRLWDSLLADEQRFRFFYYLCVALVSVNQAEILAGDFGETLSVLQHPKIKDVEQLIDLASQYLSEDGPSIDIDP